MLSGMLADERVLESVPDPPWLPAGSTVQVIRSSVALEPMSLVRLLLRRGDDVFCVPREGTGKLDLPTRATDAGDPDGAWAIAALTAATVGMPRQARFVGAVRNVVPSPPSTYPWPAPIAHFGVWHADASPIVEGSWVDIRSADSPLQERHWYPLVIDTIGR